MTEPSVVEVEARSYELDAYDHLNNAVYVNWLEHGRLCYLRDRSQTYTSIPERFGVHIVVVRQEIDYRIEVNLGDRLRIRSEIERFGRTSFRFHQEIRYLDERIAANAKVTMVCVGPAGRSVPMPGDLRQLLET